MLKKRSKKRVIPPAKAVLYCALLTAAVAVAWWAYVIFYLPAHPRPGQDPYNNLDLSLARRATYSNGPVRLVKDFGVKNGIRKELVSFAVPKDNLTEFALMTLPADQPADGYPVIILCHGYAAAERYSTLNNYLADMNFYSHHGYAVIKPDLRGNGLSLANGTATSAYYSMNYNTDVMSLIAAVKSTGYLNRHDINLWGHSMGAYIALRAAVLSTDVRKVILLSAPAGTVGDMYSDYRAISDADNPIAADIRDQELTAHGTPLSNPVYWAKTSPLDYLKTTAARIEINVGTADTVVPPKFSADLDRALVAHNIAHQYFVYPGADHGLSRQRPQIWARSLAFLAARVP